MEPFSRIVGCTGVYLVAYLAGKGVLGSDYTYNHTEAGIQKRFWFSAFGYTDVILKAGKVWDKVPFPLLIMPNANLSYTIQPESYSLMNAMEFMNDEYFSWDVTYFLNGWLFNRVPLLKKLKWREIVSCRGLYGHLSDKNNPALSDGLFAFPIENIHCWPPATEKNIQQLLFVFLLPRAGRRKPCDDLSVVSPYWG